VDHSLFCYPAILNQLEEYISELCHALAKQRIQVELVHAESTYGQLELVLPYEKDPLKMADHIVIARETIAELAKRKNMCALFLPKIFPNQAGNGMHLHLSMYDRITGKDIFSGSTPASISPTGSSFIEGILQHMPALLALTNPTRNSFRRIGKGCWTGSTCSWDIENKEVPMRVCLDLETGMATNVEYKLSDSTANVYLQIAGLIATGLDGIQRHAELRPPSSSWIAAGHAPEEIPSDLLHSIKLLMHDDCLSNMMGEPLLRSYVAMKQDEMNQNSDLTQEVLNALRRSS
jgi:glutamine synthetase